MDFMYIFDINRIVSVSHQTIDKFATWCDEFRVHLETSSKKFPQQKIQSLMERLTSYEPPIELPEVNNIFRLLTDTTMAVMEEQGKPYKVPEKTIRPKIWNRLEKFTSGTGSFLPSTVHTFDEVSINRYNKDMQYLQKMVENHYHLYQKLQKQQEVCWLAECGMSKYNIGLYKAKSNRSSMATELSRKELNTLDTYIKKIEEKLATKIQKSTEATTRNQTLKLRVSELTGKMEEFGGRILMNITNELAERIRSGIETLEGVLDTQTKLGHSDLMEGIRNAADDSGAIAVSFLDKLSCQYTYCDPQEYLEKNGPNSWLQNCYYTNCEANEQNEWSSRTQKKEVYSKLNDDMNECQDYAYVNPERVKTRQSACLLKTKAK